MADRITAAITLPAESIVVRAEARWIGRTNIEAAFGMSWRWFLDHVLPELRAAGTTIAGTRKAPLVAATDLDAYLRARAAAAVARGAPAAANDGQTLDEVDSLLARNGLRKGR